MQRDLTQFIRQSYDVLTIGGGINGAGIAHMAALNGLRTALLEKGDFASGTSSKSTKLIHGGLRYLENMEFGLVRESLRERQVQLKSAPHLVHPLRFVIPVYRTDRRPFWMMKFGVGLYDFLSGEYVLEKHRTLSVEEVCQMIPGLQREGLLGGVTYSDAQMDDARLCLENILSAAEKGAHVANYVEARSLIQENGKVVGVKAYDHLHKTAFDITAKKIVCAVGPWTNLFVGKENSPPPPPLRLTKGVHIVYRGCLSPRAMLISAQRDKRVFFIIPWLGNTLIGTTDTDFSGSPDAVDAGQEDIDYLIAETKRVLPGARIIQDDIIASFAGLRPLIYDRRSPEKISRRHVIKESNSGIIYVMGGKYTTYRKIAQDVVSRLAKGSLVNTQEAFPVYGSGEIHDDPRHWAGLYGLKPEVVQSLMDFYGTRFRAVLALLDRDPSLKELICTCSNVIRAQIVYAVQTEMALTEEDISARRLGLDYIYCPSRRCRKEIQRFLA
jgi:glycerol-3-phosphate dehydrogenase